TRDGNRRVISKRMQFVEIDGMGRVRNAGPAPYLDYRPIADAERAAVASALDAPWLRGNLESTVLSYAAEHLVPAHLDEVRRRQELEQERQVSPLPPVVIGGALVVPLGLLARLGAASAPDLHALETARVEWLAMDAVMEAERRLGYCPRDVGAQNLGYDVESAAPASGRLRFIEVKGRAKGAD